MKIVFKNQDFLVVNKPPLVPSQKDLSGDADAMTLAAEILKAKGENDKLWLVHRLDRVVGGLLVFARCPKAAAYFSAEVQNGGLFKGYLAVAEGEAPGGVLSDFIYKDSASGKAYAVKTERKGAKAAELVYKPLSFNNGKTLVDIELKTGRFHQIRVQFSSRQMSLVGDKKYGSRDSLSKRPALFAYKLGFFYNGKKYLFKALPDLTLYPWNLYEKDIYEEA
ncbi:MAG: RNA pseudouridine synthase [Clostridia bacterium]|nr:RNA pseudouridine synthase [Clostridia bacterium]